MREKCRYCGAKRREGIEWYDDDYCSGKCKTQDGGSVPPASKPDPVKVNATLDHYNSNKKLYRRRHDPERLNWGGILTPKELKQAGLRANREPIPGDWDYVEEVKEDA